MCMQSYLQIVKEVIFIALIVLCCNSPFYTFYQFYTFLILFRYACKYSVLFLSGFLHVYTYRLYICTIKVDIYFSQAILVERLV